MRRCSRCGSEWDDEETECFNCGSEETYALPEQLDIEFEAVPVVEKSKLRNLLSPERLKNKLKNRK